MSLYLGIDPGKKGALAVLDSEEMKVDVIDMPDTTAALHEWIAALPIIKLAVLEKPMIGMVAGPRQIATTFENYGVLRGAVQWRDLPFVEIAPAKWKAALDLTKQDKAASRQRASQLFPDQADLFKRVKDDGRAEAVLLAWWGSQK